MKYLYDLEKPLQFYKKTDDSVYLGQWDQNHTGWSVNLDLFPQELQKDIRDKINKKYDETGEIRPDYTKLIILNKNFTEIIISCNSKRHLDRGQPPCTGSTGRSSCCE